MLHTQGRHAAWRAVGGLGLIATQCAIAAPAAAPIKLPLPVGRVTYSVNHAMMNGTSTVTWIEGGKRFRQEAKLKVQQPGPNGPVPTQLTSTVICDGTYVYVNNSQQGKQFFRTPIGSKNSGMLTGSVPLTVDPTKTKLVGKGVVLGKPCEIREASSVRMWSWKGLPLKMEPAPGPAAAQGLAAMLSSLRVQATKIEPGIRPAGTLFKVPAGYKVVNARSSGGSPRK